MQIPKIYAQSVSRNSIDLSLSENPLGCSPRALKALSSLNAKDISRYPDQTDLLEAISINFKVSTENIILGTGSDQLIKLIASTFLKKDDIALVQRGSFPVFTKECVLAGAKVTLFTPQRIKITQKPKLIFLCTPNNPTGEVIPEKEIENILKNFKQSIIVIDEANGEFSSISFCKQAINTENVLCLRTFSKALGLAGLRVGICVGSKKLISKVSKSQQPFPISSISCKLALAALTDQKFLRETLETVKIERDFLAKELIKRGFKVSNSITLNLAVFSIDAKLIIEELEKVGVAVVDLEFFPGFTKSGFRIAIKNRKINKIFLSRLDQVLKGLKQNGKI